MTTEHEELLARCPECECVIGNAATCNSTCAGAKLLIRDLSAKLEAKEREFINQRNGYTAMVDAERKAREDIEAKLRWVFEQQGGSKASIEDLCKYKQRAEQAESMLTRANTVADSATHQVELLESRLASVFERTRERCAKVAHAAGDEATRIGNLHPEDSDSRGHMFARAREAAYIAADILALAPEESAAQGTIFSKPAECSRKPTQDNSAVSAAAAADPSCSISRTGDGWMPSMWRVMVSGYKPVYCEDEETARAIANTRVLQKEPEPKTDYVQVGTIPAAGQFWCGHVGGLGPPFPYCKICADKANAADLIPGLERAAEIWEKVHGFDKHRVAGFMRDEIERLKK